MADEQVALVPGKDYRLSSPLVITLGGAALTPKVLKQSWHENTLRYAVDKLIAEVCFGHDPIGHADCKEEWESWPDTDWALLQTDPAALKDTRYYRFYCHGAPNKCTCGHSWKGVAQALKADPALGIQVGDVLSNRCPKCLEPYDIVKLQRLGWREELAGTIGAEVEALDKLTRSVRVDMIFRLARFLVEGGMAAGATALKDAEILKSSLLHTFAGMSLKGTEIYNAADWYAKGPHVLPKLGLDMDKLEDDWTRNAMREFVPVINAVYDLLLQGGPLPDLATIMAEAVPLKERIEKVKAALVSPAPQAVMAPPTGLLIKFPIHCFIVEQVDDAGARAHTSAGGLSLELDSDFSDVEAFLVKLFGSQA